MTQQRNFVSWIRRSLARTVGYLVACLFFAWMSSHFVVITFARGQAGKSAPAWIDHPNPNAIQQPAVLAKHELFSEDHTSDVVAIEQVWGAYTFYNDSINGPGMASLFTPDGVDQHLWDDGHGKLIPDFGVVAPEDVGHNMTPEGPKGADAFCTDGNKSHITSASSVRRLR